MILAVFPTGVANITVNGLHQWDYGQQLKIKAPDLPAMVEVHFACAGMDEAIVRSCSVVNGEGIVAIPDKCLEQSAPVYAWIYEIDGTAGTTTKTILLNIITRARPQPGGDIPVEISDKYAEAVTAMNSAVVRLTAKVDETENSASEKLAEMNAVMGEKITELTEVSDQKITELTEVSDQKIGDLANMMDAQYAELAGQLESPKYYPETQPFYTGYYYISLKLSIGEVGNVIFIDLEELEELEDAKNYLIAKTYDGSCYYARVNRHGEASIIREYKSGDYTKYDEINNFKIAFLWDPFIMGGDIV